jgi:anaerobic selenocysteine-containing dehydrogenase
MDHGGCGLLVGVRDGRIVRVKGDPDGYLSRGYTCHKGLASPERLVHPERLRHPLKRIGGRGEGRWARISWEEALDLISEGLQRVKGRDGAKAVAFCQGMPKGLEHFVLIRLANAFGSPNVVAVQDVCHAGREVSGIHTCGFYPVADFHHPSRLAVLWGSNITATNEEGAICSLLLEQVKNGTSLMVVDPRKTKLAQKAEVWLQLRPGTDHLLALAFLNVIIEEGLYDRPFVETWTHGFELLSAHVKSYTPEAVEGATWVAADKVRRGARLYAASSPSAIQWGNPIEQNTHAFDAARALICLMAITGNLDVEGGNIQANEPKILGLGPFAKADLLPTKRKEMIHAFHGAIPGLMTVPPAHFRKAVLEGSPYPVRAAYVQCANPLLAYADSQRTFEAFMKLELLAVSDIFMTPTASLADVVLPAATHFEFNDIGHYGLGHGVILARPKVVDPPPECWPDIKILNALGRRLTDGANWYEDHEDLLEELLAPSGLNYAQFVEKGFLKGRDHFRKYLGKGFKTPTGKVELSLSQAQKLGLSPLPQGELGQGHELEGFPLVLTSAKSPNYLHSSYRWLKPLREREPLPRAEIHPATASQHDISEGDTVTIETPWGRITQTASLTDRVHPEVVCASYGWWFPEEAASSQYEWQRSNFNMLTTMDHLGKAFGTPNLKGLPCRLRKATTAGTDSPA